jgi:Big-like domain-containing protein/PASTA domain-containing protein
MRHQGWTFPGAAVFAAATLLAILAPAGAGATVFSFPGSEQEYDVPAGAAALTVVATGAGGGSGDNGAGGGFGSTITTTLPATGGEILYVYVGVPGPNGSAATGGAPPANPYSGGGGSGGDMGGGAMTAAGGAGGGASALRTCSPKINPFCLLSSPAVLVIAGGGGGGGGASNAGAGGAGDGTGSAGTGGATPGNPGSANMGGKAGQFGTDGIFFVGGAGAGGTSQGGGFSYDGAGGGGGGGLFGGGGGGRSNGVTGIRGGGGGGGGSSAVSSSASGTAVTADATGTPQVTITAIPKVPSCADNALNTLPGGSTVSVVLPCTTPMGLPITYAIAGAPSHGTLGAIDQATAKVSYTPAAGFAGTDSFAFRASNSGGPSSPATVTITVPPAPSSGGKPGPPASHCVVPKLKGLSLGKATQALNAARCALGKVTRPKARKHHPVPKGLVVVGQGVAPGAVLAVGSRVGVTLGVARRGH